MEHISADGLVLAIDQGTSSTKSILVDRAGRIVARGVAELGEAHPQPGWVEQDAEAIWQSVCQSVAACLQGQDATRVAGVGLSVQRESLLAWDAATGVPLAPMISWQDQRTVALIDGLRSEASEALALSRSGLPLDPMFSAAKAKWLLDTHDPERRRAGRGDIRLGTVETWLIAKLSGLPPQASPHLAEIGCASRTQLLDVREGHWDDALLDLFGIPRAALATVLPSDGPFPPVRGLAPLPDGVPLLAVMGDSHSALFAHGATRPGQVKATFGTGSSVMGLLDRPENLQDGLCLTIGWQLGGERPAFAVEGNIRASGATLRWLAALLGLSMRALFELAAQSDSHGVVLVPGFNGLGAPWWRRDAVGLISNLSLGTGRAECARAGLESVVQQVTDVLDAIRRSSGEIVMLHADGGASRSDLLMQMQADLLGRPVSRSNNPELSALGVAHLAGLGAGLWDRAGLAALPRAADLFVPEAAPGPRAEARRHWQGAVCRALGEAVGTPKLAPVAAHLTRAQDHSADRSHERVAR